MKPILDVARALDLGPEHLDLHGTYKAKVLGAGSAARPSAGRLILVSAITPTPAGEGKTTCSIGLAQGLARRGVRVRVVEPDRAAAIARAMTEARPGDIVILAGKGHEPYQVLKDKTIPFDDRAVAREVLKRYGYHKNP